MKRLLKYLGRLHRDERGAEGLEKLLIIAAVVLPLLGLLIYFRNVIGEWLNDEAGTVIDEGTQPLDPTF